MALAVNDTGKLAPWADVMYAADASWWYQNAEWALCHEGLKVTASSAVTFSSVLALEPSGLDGVDDTPGKVRTGRNSAYQCVHIATIAGASKIVLCGVDMGLKHGVHWHGPHKGRLRNPDNTLLDLCKNHFRNLAPVLARRGVDVVNCSPLSELDCFRRGELEKELEARCAPC